MRDVYVAGVGITQFGKRLQDEIWSLGRSAVLDALRDADLAPESVGLLVCGTARTGKLLGRESGVGHAVGWQCGIRRIPVFDVKAHCASGAIALNVAYNYIRSGACDTAVALGLEKLSVRSGRGRLLTADGMEAESDEGFTPAAFFAMTAERHMSVFGTTRRQLGLVAVKNRAAGALNPIAQYRQALTLEEVLAGPTVAAPLGLYDCCPTGDGAAAVVLTSSAHAAAAAAKKRVRIAASAVATGSYESMRDFTSISADALAGEKAYADAGLGPTDVDVAEVHDAFTIAEILHYEDLGFCPRGDGGRLVEDGTTSPGGRITVNPSGGLLSRGHPLGATGIAQVVELTMQLQSRCGQRQVQGNPRVALAQVSGGFMASDVASSAVTILTA